MKTGAVLLGLVAVIGASVLVLGALYLTNPLTEVAEESLALISQNRIREASELYAEGIRTDIVNRAKLEEAYRNSILTEYSSVSWHYRKVDGDWGILEGIVVTSDAAAPEIYLEVEFVKEYGEWKILGLEFYPVDY